MLSTELLAYYRQVSQRSLTVVDVETTGRFPNRDRIIEISVLRASLTEGIQHHQSDLINPQLLVPQDINRFTGISQEMVDQALPAAEVMPEYLPPLHTGMLVAHNISFDYLFLQAEYNRLGITFSRPASEQLCTVELARLMLADLPSRSLPDLVKHFHFNVGKSHRAAADTQACWLLAERLLTEVLNETDEALLARFARQWIPLKVAAEILGCSPTNARSRLAAAGVQARASRGRSNTKMYRRGDVEWIFQESQEDTQLSWL